MSVSLGNRSWAVGGLLVVAGLVGLASAAVKASHVAAAQAATQAATQTASPSAVQMVPGGAGRVAAKPGEKGATYYWLESRVRRVTTRFADAVTVAERATDGDLQTRITDVSGNELGRLRVDRIDDAKHVVQYMTAKGESLQALGQAGTKPTLDWANQQAYQLWRDGVKPGAPLEWQGTVMRPRRSPAHRVEDDVLRLEVEWQGGLTATAERRTVGDRTDIIPGRVLRGPVVITRLTRDGVSIGVANWFPKERVFVWNLKGLTSGYLDAEILKPVGGWTFEPDIFWVSLQTLAFHDFKTQIDERGLVAERRPGLVEKLAGLIEPSVRADEPGCDGLHWLDGTIFRYCCDTHDLCYAKFGCTSYSWWQWWSSWQCDGCNLGVVYCFGGGHGIFSPYAG
ncbi:MAG TPA: hypothetical protein VFB07_05455 [Vicinamibacterales bacterium]|nr:hypothetical protein [Vicinamibacterales bacterium]